MARDEGVTGVVGQILSYPITVHPKFAPKDKYEYGSWQQNHNSSICDAITLEWFLDQYMPEPTDDWRLSSLLAPSLKNLPPACERSHHTALDIFPKTYIYIQAVLLTPRNLVISVCGYDPLRDDAFAYAERLKEEGGDVELHTFKGLPHALTMLAEHPKTQEYYANLVAFVKKFSG